LQGWYSLPTAQLRTGEDPATTALTAWPYIHPKKAEMVDAVPVSPPPFELDVWPHLFRLLAFLTFGVCGRVRACLLSTWC
jgi:hypothetical protein